MRIKNCFLYVAILIFSFGESHAQVLVPVVGAFIGTSIQSKEHFLRKVEFDTGFSVVGLVPGADTTNAFKNLSFQINSFTEFKLMQKQWYGRENPVSMPDQNLYRLYIIKDHEVKQTWNIFPGVSLIYGGSAYYSFDSSFLKEAAIKYPLNYIIKIDSFNSNEAFVKFKQDSKNDPLFLFLIDPSADFEGGFEVSVNFNNKIANYEDAAKALMNYCSKTAKKSTYKIYQGENSSAANQAVFIVKTSKEFYDRFDFTGSSKNLWKPRVLIVRSYWKS